MSLAKTYVSPVSLPGPRPRVLPKTAAEWADHIAFLQQLTGQLALGTWTAATLLNSWAKYSGAGSWNPVGFRATLDGRVQLRGLLNGNTAALPSTIFTLPYAPQFEQLLQGTALTSGAVLTPARIDIDTSGNVILKALFAGSLASGNSSWVSLDGLSFSLAP